MPIPLFDRRERLLQLGMTTAALAMPVTTMLRLSTREFAGEATLRRVIAKLSMGRKFGPGRTDAWCVVTARVRGVEWNVWVQVLPTTIQSLRVEVSAKAAPKQPRLATDKLVTLAALGFQEPGSGTSDWMMEIPRADTRSTDAAARIAALTLMMVFGARSLADANATLFRPGEARARHKLGQSALAISADRHPAIRNFRHAPPEAYRGGGFMIGGVRNLNPPSDRS